MTCAKMRIVGTQRAVNQSNPMTHCPSKQRDIYRRKTPNHTNDTGQEVSANQLDALLPPCKTESVKEATTKRLKGRLSLVWLQDQTCIHGVGCFFLLCN